MSWTFFNCKELESVGDISKWDVSNVTYMVAVFAGCPIKEKFKPKFK